MMKDRASSIIMTLDSIERIDNEEVAVHGVLNGLNIRSHSFEMGVEGFGIIRGTALPEILMAIAECLGAEIDATMIKSNSLTKAGAQTINWYLSTASPGKT